MKETRILQTIKEWRECKQAIPQNGLIIFKFSSTCPISRGVERDFDAWYTGLVEETDLLCVKVNVRGSRELSQHITQEFSISHESPQAIWINRDQNVLWHASHRSIKAEALKTQLATMQKQG